MTPYVIHQGDYVAKLAHVMGFDADTVWNDPANADLKALRQTPDILLPGDILQVPTVSPPGISVASSSANSYQASVPRIEVVLLLKDETATPLPNEPCEVEGGGEAGDPDPPPQSSDGEGKLSSSLPCSYSSSRSGLARSKAVEVVLESLA